MFKQVAKGMMLENNDQLRERVLKRKAREILKNDRSISTYANILGGNHSDY